MRFFNFFITRRKTPPQKKKSPSRRASKIDEILRDMCLSFRRDITAIKTRLDRHDSVLAEHGRLLDDHAGKLLSLEQRLMAPPIPVPQNHAPPSLPTQPPLYTTGRQRHIDTFSPQEKRILSVFFQNKEMSFSYLDIAKVLNKSANTIKNQVHQLCMKADLFEKTVDLQNRNRFKLKEGLKIEPYLNIN